MARPFFTGVTAQQVAIASERILKQVADTDALQPGGAGRTLGAEMTPAMLGQLVAARVASIPGNVLQAQLEAAIRVDPATYSWLPPEEAETAGQHHRSARAKALSLWCLLPPDWLYPQLTTSVLLTVTMTPAEPVEGRSIPDLRMGVEFLSGSVSPVGEDQIRTIILPPGRGPRKVRVTSGTGGSEASSAPAADVVPVPIFRPPETPPPRQAGCGAAVAPERGEEVPPPPEASTAVSSSPRLDA